MRGDRRLPDGRRRADGAAASTIAHRGLNHHEYTTDVVKTLLSTVGRARQLLVDQKLALQIKDPQKSTRSPAVTRATVMGRKPSNAASRRS